MVFGTFDGLHKGHSDFFRQAKRYGDYLIVIVARDKTVKKLKGRLPLYNEKERLEAVKNSKSVDETKLGSKNNPYQIINKIKPEIICLGYDQKSFTNNLRGKLREMGLETKVYRLKPYKPQKYHSSIIMHKEK